MVEYKDGLITVGFVASLERPGMGCPSPSSMFQSEGLHLIIELVTVDEVILHRASSVENNRQKWLFKI